MAITLIYLGINIFEAFLFYYYAQTLFQTSVAKKWRVLFTALTFGVLFGVNLLQNGILNGLVIPVGLFVLTRFVYRQKTVRSLVYSLLYFTLLDAGEYLVIPISKVFNHTQGVDFHQDFHTMLFGSVFSKLLHLLLIMIALVILKKINKVGQTDVAGLTLIILVPVANTLVLCLLEYWSAQVEFNQTFTIVWVGVSALMLVECLLVFYNRDHLIRQSEKINELNLETQRKELDAQYFSVVESTNAQMQILSHDFKNHLAQIAGANSLEEVRAYVQQLYPSIRQVQTVNISGNNTLNLIIGKYNSLCALGGVAFTFHVESALDFMEAGDLTALLGNLLDNALEAAQNSEEKCMDLKLFEKNEKLVTCIITNSCAEAPRTKEGELLSTKAEGALHGIGLKSVQKTVEKYGGFYKWEYAPETKRFQTVVSFYCKGEKA